MLWAKCSGKMYLEKRLMHQAGGVSTELWLPSLSRDAIGILLFSQSAYFCRICKKLSPRLLLTMSNWIKIGQQMRKIFI